jgi:hypothetical protein
LSVNLPKLATRSLRVGVFAALLLACSLTSGREASAAVMIAGIQLTVALDNTVTITGQGSSQFFGDVGTAGNYPFIAGWGVSSGTITWKDTNGNTAATLDSTGVHVPVSGRIANSNGTKTGSVVLTASQGTGATLRGFFGGGVHAFTMGAASGSLFYEFSGTATIEVDTATLLDGIDLDVDSDTNVVTVVWSGDPVGFGNVGDAGVHSLVNGWSVASGDLSWRNAASTVVATLYAPGLNVPTTGLLATSSTSGSIELAGSTTLGAALKSQYGLGTAAFTSLAVQSPSTDFYFAGTVTIATPEPASSALGSSALLVLALLRSVRRVRRRG